MVTAFLITYTFHCTWVTSEAYSSPSIVLSARSGDGGRIIFDDFREAYYWLRQNTAEVSGMFNNNVINFSACLFHKFLFHLVCIVPKFIFLLENEQN